jgi:hypothetical protein
MFDFKSLLENQYFECLVGVGVSLELLFWISGFLFTFDLCSVLDFSPGPDTCTVFIALLSRN